MTEKFVASTAPSFTLGQITLHAMAGSRNQLAVLYSAAQHKPDGKIHRKKESILLSDPKLLSAIDRELQRLLGLCVRSAGSWQAGAAAVQ